MKSLIAAVFVLLPAAAWGQGPAATDERTVPHDCLAYYPDKEAKAGVEGTTSLRFVITDEGRVEDVEIEKSSGNGDLDQAALKCTRKWRYSPATANGRPVQVNWKADIVWKTQVPQIPAFSEEPANCLKSYPVQPADLKGISGVSEYEYIIAKGRVAKVTLIASSGNRAMDAAGSACIATRRYVREMAMVDGKEQDRYVSTTLREKINWADALKK